MNIFDSSVTITITSDDDFEAGDGVSGYAFGSPGRA